MKPAFRLFLRLFSKQNTKNRKRRRQVAGGESYHLDRDRRAAHFAGGWRSPPDATHPVGAPERMSARLWVRHVTGLAHFGESETGLLKKARVGFDLIQEPSDELTRVLCRSVPADFDEFRFRLVDVVDPAHA